MGWKVVVQVKDQVFSGKYTISVIIILTKFKRACDSSRIHRVPLSGFFETLERFRTCCYQDAVALVVK